MYSLYSAYINEPNLQTFVCNLIINIGQNRAVVVWLLLSVSFILLLSLTAFVSAFFSTNSRNSYSFVNHPLTFCFIISLAILTLRFPHFSRHELNVDESQWIASAITLSVDGRFWLSVDNATSGPLISLSLLLIKLFGASINYGTVKLFGALIWVFSFIFIYHALKLFSDESITRFSLIPPVICVACFTFSDYVAYNSEHIPILMLSACIFFSVSIQLKQEHVRRIHIVVLGLILGCIPYSKLQTVPTALCITFFTMLFLNKKQNILFLISGLLPSILVGSYLLSFGIVEDFWKSYILNNLEYAKDGVKHGLSFYDKIKQFPDFVFSEYTKNTNYFFFFYSALSLIYFTIVLAVLRKQVQKKDAALIIFALLLVLSSVYSVIQPGNYFEHYLLLLIIPLTFLFATLSSIFYAKICGVFTSFKKHYLAIIFVLMLVFSFSIYYNSRNSTVFRRALSNYILSQQVSKVSEIILTNTSKNDKISVWGWASEYYVETQLAQGNRDTHSFYQITNGSLQNYYLNRYAQDIIKNKPAYFINAVSDKHFAFTDTSKYSYNLFPPINKVIDSLYTYEGKIEGAKLYKLKSQYKEQSKYR